MRLRNSMRGLAYASSCVKPDVLAAFRNHHRRATWRRTFEWASIGAVAAILLVFLWTVGGPSRGQSSPSPRKDVSSQSRGPLDAKGSQSPPNDKLTQSADVEVADSSSSLAYAASDFVPVPLHGRGFCRRSRDGRTRSIDASFVGATWLSGLPRLRTKDLIRADVLVGEDGWPRGVKLVQ